MKRFTILFVFLSIIASLRAQTYVSGGIYSSQTWTTAGSPYIIIGHVVVFQKVAVTIQPGVVVKFDSNAILEVRGYLFANGTPSDSITFTSNLPTPQMGDYSGIITPDTCSFRYCNFYYGDSTLRGSSLNNGTPIAHCTFRYNFCGIYSLPRSLDTCNFYYNETGTVMCGCDRITNCNFLYNSGGIWWGGALQFTNNVFKYNGTGVWAGTGSISHCVFDSNTGMGISGEGTGFHMTYCEIKYNGTGLEPGGSSGVYFNDISNNTIGIIHSLPDDTIMCNSICNNITYDLENFSSLNFNIQHNYWCLTDSAQIQAKIYDAHQNISYGIVFFTPFDTVQCSSIPTGIEKIANASPSISIYPNPSNGKFTIEAPGINGPSLLSVYNVLGEKVLTATLKDAVYNQIDLPQQPSGVYFIRLISETGQLEGEAKVVKQ
jgi:hypothetical protein